jgi:hypothetical protein
MLKKHLVIPALSLTIVICTIGLNPTLIKAGQGQSTPLLVAGAAGTAAIVAYNIGYNHGRVNRTMEAPLSSSSSSSPSRDQNLNGIKVVEDWVDGGYGQGYAVQMAYDAAYYTNESPHGSGLCEAKKYATLVNHLNQLSSENKESLLACYQQPRAQWPQDLNTALTKMGTVHILNSPAFEEVVKHIIKHNNV